LIFCFTFLSSKKGRIKKNENEKRNENEYLRFVPSDSSADRLPTPPFSRVARVGGEMSRLTAEE
jgi:hypothetical protein